MKTIITNVISYLKYTNITVMLKTQWYKYKETLFEYISFADVTMGKGEDKTFFGYNSMLQKPSQVSKSKAFVN